MRDPKFIAASLLMEAIEQARSGLKWPVEKVEKRGSLIQVTAGEDFVFFRIEVSHAGQVDEVSCEAMPTAGGTSFDLRRIPASDTVQANGEWSVRNPGGGPFAQGSAAEPSRRWRRCLCYGACVILMLFAGFVMGETHPRAVSRTSASHSPRLVPSNLP